MTNFHDTRDIAKAQYDHTEKFDYWTKVGLGEHLAFLHSEVSELFEAYRKGPNKPCDKGIELTAEEEEMADIALVFLNLVHKRGIDLEKAIRIKFAFNQQRDLKRTFKLIEDTPL